MQDNCQQLLSRKSAISVFGRVSSYIPAGATEGDPLGKEAPSVIQLRYMLHPQGDPRHARVVPTLSSEAQRSIVRRIEAGLMALT